MVDLTLLFQSVNIAVLVTTVLVMGYSIHTDREIRKDAAFFDLIKLEADAHMPQPFVIPTKAKIKGKWKPTYALTTRGKPASMDEFSKHVKYLNILDIVGTAVKYGMVDEKKAKAQFEVLIRGYSNVKKYIKKTRELEESPEIYDNLEWLYHKWNPK